VCTDHSNSSWSVCGAKMASAADAAAAAVSMRPPPPLPLPPGTSVQSLPALLRPARRSAAAGIVGAVFPASSSSSSGVEGRRDAATGGAAGGAAAHAEPCPQQGDRANPPVWRQAEGRLLQARTPFVSCPRRDTSQPVLGLARGTTVVASEVDASGGGGADGSECRASSSKARMPPKLDDAYLWVSRSDRQIAKEIQQTLCNFDILVQECDDLFGMCCVQSDAEGSFGDAFGSSSQSRVQEKQLREITQTLIDKLGCRAEPVLERISQIFGAAVAGDTGSGLGLVEFRGYVAAVLTQIHRELEERGWDVANKHECTSDAG